MKKTASKKFLSILLALAMVLSYAPFAASAAATQPAGSGTTADPYQIGSADELAWFTQQVNSGETGLHAVLTKDIELPTVKYTPIGQTSETAFSGVFDGRSYTIDFGYVSDFSDYYGLFGFIDGTVKNVKIAGFSLGANKYSYIGTIAGYNRGTVQNCENLGEKNLHGDIHIGGIVGFNDTTGVIENCRSTAAIFGDLDIGGIAGSNDGIIRNCTNEGTVDPSTASAGGIVGSNGGGTVENCTNNGEIAYSSAYWVGGIVGQNQGTVSGCVNNAAVSGNTQIGGIAGRNDGSVEKCTNNGLIYGSSTGGIVGQNYGTISGCLNTGEITGSGQDNGGIAGDNRETIVNSANRGEISGAEGGGIAGSSDGSITTSYDIGESYYAVYWNNGTLDGVYHDGKNSKKACYYSTVEASGIQVTDDQITGGELAYLLNKAVTDGTQAWYQNLDNGAAADACPLPDGTHGTVYRKCNGETYVYSNNTEGMTHIFTGECDTLCDVCGYIRQVSVEHIEGTPANCLNPATCKTCGSLYGEVAGVHDVDPETAVCDLCKHGFAIKYQVGDTVSFTDDANIAFDACIGRSKSGTVTLFGDVTYNGTPPQVQSCTATIVFNGHTATISGKGPAYYGTTLTLDASKGGTLNATNSQPIQHVGNGTVKIIGNLVYARNGQPTAFDYRGIGSYRGTLDLTEYTGSGLAVKGSRMTVQLPQTHELISVSTGAVVTSLSDSDTAQVISRHTHNTDGTVTYEKLNESQHNKKTGCSLCPYATVTAEDHTLNENGKCSCGFQIVAQVGETAYYDLQKAVDEAGSQTVQLLADTDETVEISETVTLDLNGFDLTGTVTLAEEKTLFVKDSRTDDYTVEDAYGYGRMTAVPENVVAAAGYMMITEADGTSFHRLNLDTASVTLRAANTGIYYQNQFGGDEVIKRNIVAYGTALGADKLPNFDNEKTYTRFADMTTWSVGMDAKGNSNNMKNGTALVDIMLPGNGYSLNSHNSKVKIYSQAYVELPDGSRILGSAVCFSLQEVLEGTENLTGADVLWDTLEQEQKTPILEMYAAYEKLMRQWNIPNIKAAAQ